MTASSGLAALPVDGPIGRFGAGVHSQGVPVQVITGGAPRLWPECWREGSAGVPGPDGPGIDEGRSP